MPRPAGSTTRLPRPRRAATTGGKRDATQYFYKPQQHGWDVQVMASSSACSGSGLTWKNAREKGEFDDDGVACMKSIDPFRVAAPSARLTAALRYNLLRAFVE